MHSELLSKTKNVQQRLTGYFEKRWEHVPIEYTLLRYTPKSNQKSNPAPRIYIQCYQSEAWMLASRLATMDAQVNSSLCWFERKHTAVCWQVSTHDVLAIKSSLANVGALFPCGLTTLLLTLGRVFPLVFAFAAFFLATSAFCFSFSAFTCSFKSTTV